MSIDPGLADLAAGWRPQRPGRRRPKDIRDALVEPEWEGLRVVAVIGEREAAFVHEGEPLTLPAELPQAILEACNADDALIEGRLTTRALVTGEGVALPETPVERPSLIIPRGLFGRRTSDPYLRARDHERLAIAEAPHHLEELERGVRHAFVATDLLWLDGTPLHDIPLLERKRLLGSVVDETYLVRVTPFVTAAALPTHVTWASMGFRELHYRDPNSRYLAGEENPDCAVAPPPPSLASIRGRR
jgi:hypothetical protein